MPVCRAPFERLTCPTSQQRLILNTPERSNPLPILEVQRRINAPPELVWEVIADLDGEAAMLPAMSRIDLQGEPGANAIRRIHLQDGRTWTETCVDWVAGQRYTLQVEAQSFPVHFKSLRYTCSVVAADPGVLLRLYFDYQSQLGLAGALLGRLKAIPALRGHAVQMIDNWVRIVHGREWAHRVTVRSLLADKGAQVHAIDPGQRVADAVALLSEKRIGALLALHADGSIAGVLAERDIVVGLADQGERLLQQPVASIMSSRVIVADPQQNMLQLMACMSEQRIRHLPVVEQGRVLGLISIGDVIKARLSELEGQSASLEEYIAVRRWHDLYREIGPTAYAIGALPSETERT